MSSSSSVDGSVVSAERFTSLGGRPWVSIAGQILKGAGGFVALGALWQLLRTVGILNRGVTPSAFGLVSDFVNGFHSGLVSASLSTVTSWALALGLAAAVGVPLGLLVGLSKLADSLTGVLFDLLRPVPPIALLPVAIVVLGIGNRMEIAVTAVGAVWPIIIGAQYGVRQTEPLYVQTARSMRLSSMETTRRVVLLAALPSIATGIRVAAPLTLAIIVGVEVVNGSGSGLGAIVATSSAADATQLTYAGIIAAAILGMLIILVFRFAERRILRWSPEHR